MEYTLSLTRHAAETLHTHLLDDQDREQMAITLCGVNRLHREMRLLVRDVILLPPDAFNRQSATCLELKQDVQAFVHQLAHRHGLVQVDWHSHPGRGHYLRFSSTDDRYEAAQAAYLAHRMDGVPYASVVVNEDALDARIWITHPRRKRGKKDRPQTVIYRPRVFPLQAVMVGDLHRRIPASIGQTEAPHPATCSPIYDRQVRAFGQQFQRKLGNLLVGVVGVGGLGSAIVEQLSRLGVQDWVLVDPDVVDLANLNRLVNATQTDAQKGRPKVYVARSSIRQPNPKARVRALQTDVFDPEAQRLLKRCDLLIVATDNHSSRMALNRLAVQYLIPLLHAGFHIGVDEENQVNDVSGEFALPDLGRWCLQCAGIVDPQVAGWELAPENQREMLRRRGYVVDTPAPAVRHLDGTVASLAATEVHNLVQAFKPQHRYLTYDALRGEILSLQVTPSRSCPVCSPDHGVLGLGDLEPLPDYRRADRALSLPPVSKHLPDRSRGQPDEQAPAPSHQLVTPIPSTVHTDRSGRLRRLEAAMEEGEEEWP